VRARTFRPEDGRWLLTATSPAIVRRSRTGGRRDTPSASRAKTASRGARCPTTEILKRCLYPLVNEAAKELDEGIAARPGDVDVVWIYGYGFPVWRGGPLRWADSVGIATIVDDMREFERVHGSKWTPAPLLVELAENGGTLCVDRAQHRLNKGCRSKAMREAVIVSTARTPIGKAFRGAFNDTHGAGLASHVIRHAVEAQRPGAR